MPRKAKAGRSDLTFTGERIVPQATNCEPNFASRMQQEHIVRYNFAAQLVAGKAVLDVGCGVGYGSQYLAQAGAKRVRAFDLSQDAINHARKYYSHSAVEFSTGNAESFDFGRNYDIITCFELIEHVNDPYKVVANIKCSLRPDGILLMSTPRALEHKRTHFHMHEFSYDEFLDMLGTEFPALDIYVENNHFSSLITQGSPSSISRIVCLKDQYDAAIADVFIAVAGPTADMRLPAMQAAISLDSDAYVTMLERDVDILHKAENDARELFEHTVRSHANREDFKDKEIVRLTDEYNILFSDAESLREKLWNLEKLSADSRESLNLRLEEKDREIADLKRETARLADEHILLSTENENVKSKLWYAEQSKVEMQVSAAHQIEQGKLEAAILNKEISEIKDNYNNEYLKIKDENNLLIKEKSDLNAEYSDYKYKINRTVAGLMVEVQHAELEIERLKSEYAALYSENESNVALLREEKMKNSEIERDMEELRAELEAFSTRVADADARRADAYDFARTSSDRAHGLQHDLDALKRDIAEVLETPQAASDQIYDHRHRDIVESMQRVFMGTEATRAIGRDPLVNRVARVAMEAELTRAAATRSEEVLQQQQDQIAGLQVKLEYQRSELHNLRAELSGSQSRCAALEERVRDIQLQADNIQQLADVRQGQIDRLRSSVSWRSTAPLRKLVRFGRRRR